MPTITKGQVVPSGEEPAEIQIGRLYGEDHGHARRILSIRGGVVTYALKGALSFRPLRCSVQEFRRRAARNTASEHEEPSLAHEPGAMDG